MQHPQRLGWADELPEGYYLDELGQVRHSASGDLVCGWSGRGHRHYLLPFPVPDPEIGTIKRVWLSKHVLQAWGREIRENAREGASAGLRGLVRRLFGMALDVLIGKLR